MTVHVPDAQFTGGRSAEHLVHSETSSIQAYIFAILATVFIGAAIESTKKVNPQS